MSSSVSGRAGTYRVVEQDMNIPSRSPFITNRSKSTAYAANFPDGSQVIKQYPKSVITVAFYDQPAAVAASMSEHSGSQLVRQSPQRRAGRAGRTNSPKPGSRHQVGMKKLGGGGGGVKALSQRTTSASPTAAGHYASSSGYFTITAYLPFDGGKRLRVRINVYLCIVYYTSVNVK